MRDINHPSAHAGEDHRSLKIVILSTIICLSAIGGPIMISGSGHFAIDTSIGGFSTFDLSFSGSNGSDSVSASDLECQGFPLGCLGPVFSGGLGVDIDGMHFSNGYFSYSGFSITGYNASIQPMVMESLFGYVEMGAESCIPEGGAGQYCQGNFTVTSTPEPATFLLTMPILALMALRRRAVRPEQAGPTHS
jgi:hypothetical protein